MPDDILREKAAFVRSRPTVRPAQEYGDFSACMEKITNGGLDGKSSGGRVSLSGGNCVDYAAFVGFRGDEPARIARMRERNKNDGAEYKNGGDPHSAVPEGEYVYAPLGGMGVSKEDVFRFWAKQKWDLRLPHNLNFSNCVYCFLKGSGVLAGILADRKKTETKLPKKLRPQENTPGDIRWWARMEEKYGRDLVREKRAIQNEKTAGERPIIGFWGMNGRLSYRRLADSQFAPSALSQIGMENAALPCDCTD
ncbi:MAG: hypothetical protein ACR2P5_04255 [Gammaproteobacteria bacterium]